MDEYLVSAGVTVMVVAFFGSTTLTQAVRRGLATFVMNMAQATHPPGGAAALIGVEGVVVLGFIPFPPPAKPARISHVSGQKFIMPSAGHLTVYGNESCFLYKICEY